MIKAIIFDVGGVLQLGDYKKEIRRHCNLGVHGYISKKLKLNLDTWFDSIDSVYADSIEGKIPKKKLISIISKNVKTSPKRLVKIIIKAHKKKFKKNRRLYSIAFKLKKKGYNIGILSDQWHLSKEALLPLKDIKDFSPVIISCDVGIRKPNPKIYKMLIKKCKCNANEILFIDNRDWNLKPAKKLGIKTILFKDNKQLIGKLKGLKIL